ncbi:hypothetical protein QAD02_001786 [Eretmocerus hayati]|uniref:Uncharacterized protein n=1 Tax=Eretmocerus hayati TaxID=131215 RepID=A0ACC2NJW9_9HYME|nr:hypothetical protein QAD02_001786 [Eretmocerus hayati]
MSIFTQNVNPITGITVWEERDPNYDYYQEIARAAFADMLHDHERNHKYYLALKAAIDKKHEAGEQAHVLDIGTGTGLLSMMAAKCGADIITACETFRPMAECAKKIIEKNKLEKQIQLIYKRSTKIVINGFSPLLTDADDLPRKANILVTEVFDTELIGEGALSTFKHALDFLLEDDPVVVPSCGTIWVQIVDSPTVRNWNRVNPVNSVTSGETLIEVPEVAQSCSGASAVHDIQLSQLPQDSFTPLTDPIPIFKFDWTGSSSLDYNEHVVLPIKTLTEGTAHAVFMWWHLDMDMDSKIQLSCAPVWAHPDVQKEIKDGKPYKELADKIPWRDHWMQAVYYFPNDLNVTPSEEVLLVASHDEYSFWYSLEKKKKGIENFKRPMCECCIHLAFSRTRIGQLNDVSRNDKYLKAISKKVTPDTVCLVISDSSLLGLSIAKMGIKKLYILESNPLSQKTVKLFIEKNGLTEIVSVIESADDLPPPSEITLIFAEPFHVTSILPWDNFYHWYLASKYPASIPRIPQRAVMKAVAMEFKDLHKIRAPLGICEGFDLTIFDELVQSSSLRADSPVEAQPLWEYPGRALSNVFTLADVNFCSKAEEHAKIESSCQVPIVVDGSCNGIAIWVDWHLDDEICVSSGPVEEIVPGSRVSWDWYSRQGVHLLSNITQVSNKNVVVSAFAFNAREGLFEFSFNVK